MLSPLLFPIHLFLLVLLLTTNKNVSLQSLGLKSKQRLSHIWPHTEMWMGPVAWPQSWLYRRFAQAEQSLGWDSLVAGFIFGRQMGFLWLISSPGQTHASFYSSKFLHASGWRRLNSEDAPEQWQVKSCSDNNSPTLWSSLAFWG